ncbi:MAG: hypothetical protein IKS41_00710 [Alphaproteobacteria bacterium]|nr:hypothetical protein [Alphaproteobacteria bacterium]
MTNIPMKLNDEERSVAGCGEENAVKFDMALVDIDPEYKWPIGSHSGVSSHGASPISSNEDSEVSSISGSEISSHSGSVVSSTGGSEVSSDDDSGVSVGGGSILSSAGGETISSGSGILTSSTENSSVSSNTGCTDDKNCEFWQECIHGKCKVKEGYCDPKSDPSDWNCLFHSVKHPEICTTQCGALSHKCKYGHFTGCGTPEECDECAPDHKKCSCEYDFTKTETCWTDADCYPNGIVFNIPCGRGFECINNICEPYCISGGDDKDGKPIDCCKGRYCQANGLTYGSCVCLSGLWTPECEVTCGPGNYEDCDSEDACKAAGGEWY